MFQLDQLPINYPRQRLGDAHSLSSGQLDGAQGVVRWWVGHLVDKRPNGHWPCVWQHRLFPGARHLPRYLQVRVCAWCVVCMGTGVAWRSQVSSFKGFFVVSHNQRLQSRNRYLHFSVIILAFITTPILTCRPWWATGASTTITTRTARIQNWPDARRNLGTKTTRPSSWFVTKTTSSVVSCVSGYLAVLSCLLPILSFFFLFLCAFLWVFDCLWPFPCPQFCVPVLLSVWLFFGLLRYSVCVCVRARFPFFVWECVCPGFFFC